MFGTRGAALGHGVKLHDLKSFSTAKQQKQQRAVVARAQRRCNASSMKPRVVIRKKVDRQTLISAVRTLIVGGLLIGLGAAMAGVGYYSKFFATETLVSGNGTVTEQLNKMTQAQYVSLQYIGPVIMGVGAFLLMIACVMTLESRDKHMEVVREIPRDEEANAPGTGMRRRPTQRVRKAGVPRIGTTDSAHNDQDAFVDADIVNNNSADATSGQALGAVNRCFMREESNRVASDYSPSGAYGARASLSQTMREAEGKFPSTSQIDALGRCADPRALLQRFFEDQHVLADRGMQERNVVASDDQDRLIEICDRPSTSGQSHRHTSSSTYATKSDTTGNGTASKHSIVAEVHHSSEESPRRRQIALHRPVTRTSRSSGAPQPPRVVLSGKMPRTQWAVAGQDSSTPSSGSHVTLSLDEVYLNGPPCSSRASSNDSLEVFASPVSLTSERAAPAESSRQQLNLRVNTYRDRTESQVSMTSYQTARMSAYWCPTPDDTEYLSLSMDNGLDSNANNLSYEQTLPLSPGTPSTIQQSNYDVAGISDRRSGNNNASRKISSPFHALSTRFFQSYRRKASAPKPDKSLPKKKISLPAPLPKQSMFSNPPHHK